MEIDRVEVSKSFYEELLAMNQLNQNSVEYNELFQGVKIVVNTEIKQGYKIIYQENNSFDE